MSREASRERARTLAQAMTQLHAALAEPALLGYPVAVLYGLQQRSAVPAESAAAATGAELVAPAVEARVASTYKE